MPDETHRLEDLLADAVAGCEASAAELVQRFERQIRLEIRTRMCSVRIRRVVDSMDIAQSAFTAFLIGLRDGTLEMRGSREALALLTTIARRKLAQQVRFHTAGKRDIRRTVSGIALDEHVSRRSIQSTADIRETLTTLEREMGAESVRVLRRRIAGEGWQEIARSLNISVDAARMRAKRSLELVRNRVRCSGPG